MDTRQSRKAPTLPWSVRVKMWSSCKPTESGLFCKTESFEEEHKQQKTSKGAYEKCKGGAGFTG